MSQKGKCLHTITALYPNTETSIVIYDPVDGIRSWVELFF